MNKILPDFSGNPKSPEQKQAETAETSRSKQKQLKQAEASRNIQGSIILMEIIRVSTADQKTNPDSEHTE